MRTVHRTISYFKESASDQSGFGVMQVILLAAIAAISALVVVNMLDASATAEMQGRNRAVLASIRKNLVALVHDPAAMEKTATNEPTMACLLSATDCSAMSGSHTPFTLYDASGTPYASGDPTTTLGFNLGGSPCNTFPSVECPIRFDLTWIALCYPGSCAARPIEVNGAPILNAGPAATDEIRRLFGPVVKLDVYKLGDPPIPTVPPATPIVTPGERTGYSDQYSSVFIGHDEPPNTHEGHCSTAWQRRKVNVIRGFYGLAATGASQDSIIFKKDGHYVCSFTIPAFSGGSHEARFVKVAGAAGYVTAMSQTAYSQKTAVGAALPEPRATQVSLTLETSFDVLQNELPEFAIEQRCSNSGGQAWEFGYNNYPTGIFVTGSRFIVGRCSRSK